MEAAGRPITGGRRGDASQSSPDQRLHGRVRHARLRRLITCSGRIRLRGRWRGYACRRPARTGHEHPRSDHGDHESKDTCGEEEQPDHADDHRQPRPTARDHGGSVRASQAVARRRRPAPDTSRPRESRPADGHDPHGELGGRGAGPRGACQSDRRCPPAPDRGRATDNRCAPCPLEWLVPRVVAAMCLAANRPQQHPPRAVFALRVATQQSVPAGDSRPSMLCSFSSWAAACSRSLSRCSTVSSARTCDAPCSACSTF